MIVKQELVKKIKMHFDLNIYETKVWLALVSKGIATAGEIAEVSGIPRSRTYDVLESLEKRGFAIAKIGKPIKYIAIKPVLVIEKLKKELVKGTNEKMNVLSKLRETNEYKELEHLYKEGINPIDKSELSASIKGKNNISAHLNDMIENAENEVIICTTYNDIMSKLRSFSHMINKLKKKKVSLKFAINGSQDEIKKIESQFDIKVISIPIKSRFYIIDQREILFNINDSEKDNDEVGIWIDSDFFTKSIAHLFERVAKINQP
ncbi:hypothetical protein HYV49_00710 [Candidatus Pacearchaeota archaeon]|nr:hypothetical protein [Candidatus Pacearchaeota archaeon]